MSTVYVVHCVDTEGPLYESIDEVFLRLRDALGISGIVPTAANLAKIQNQELDLGGKEKAAATMTHPRLLDYNADWPAIDKMLFKIMSKDFRKSVPDSFGNGWKFSWHCMDHLDYEVNPRRRAVGIHAIYDHYVSMLAQTGSDDHIHWHFHPQHYYKEGHRSATSYVNSPNLYKILCRRIIERNWFPTCHRSGFHTERPDSHWFLEQWIPFDFSNQSMPEEDNSGSELTRGRFGDWRGAPSDWSVYHPAHDDYRATGSCRRKIARCLNVGTRHHLITQREVDKAFERAQKVGPTLMCVTDHDFRDMSINVLEVHSYLQAASKRYPQVKFQYADAREGMRLATFAKAELDKEVKLSLEVALKDKVLTVDTHAGSVFGPQPFLAIQTTDDRFFHDNFDVVTTGKRWSYSFDRNSIPLEAVARVGVAANDRFGNFDVKKVNNIL